MVLVPTQQPDDFELICKTLFGDVVDPDELRGFSKASPDQSTVNGGGSNMRRNFERASNAIGITAGVLGAKGAWDDFGEKRREAKGKPPKVVKVPKKGSFAERIKRPKTAYGLASLGLGIQGVNMAGDALIAGTLASTGKKKEDFVAKADAVPDAKTIAARQARMKSAGAKLKPSYLVRTARANPIKTTLGAIGASTVANTVGSGVSSVSSMVRPSPYTTYAKSDDTQVFRGEFSKFDDDKRLAFGWASVCKINGMPVVDHQGDYISLDDLEEAAYSYVHKSRVGGDMHRRTGDAPHHVSDMIESIVFTDDKVKKMGLPDDFPRGWWVGFKVHDEKTWDLVRKGGRTGFSIHGRGKRVPMSYDEVMES